ncbi:MG2 domain-containing protein [Variovorax sp. IB41]|uniref:MG2 domain-containing protein n=1 Tax=Variovorax sp. IB41 TaxID=2779370 RepID=UPI0018E7EFBA|nr:alpha-2-macroglobulin [Variovorax sp. IB41]
MHTPVQSLRPLLRRLFPLALAAATALAAMQPLATHAAPDAQPQPLENSRSPYTGEPFFLLSDATFASDQTALVRLEVNQPSALEQVGGVDVLVYRIPDALAFLQKQKNLHRVQVGARPADEGLANTLTHLWDSWVVKSRLAWQRMFSASARRAVTQQAPELKTPAKLTQPSVFEEPRQFRPIPGLPVVERFRYPVHKAQPIGLPKGVKLEGSSSEFITASQGNVFVPVGKRAPGLYLVEAISGQFRATTLLFVSDTVAITKVSGDQMLVWAAQRAAGAPVAGTKVVWTDGVGVLKSGEADAQGLVKLDRPSPEQTYVFGQDPAGGVFISENFYYDSEIYNAKVYTVTDRPLYRPGDWVNVKVSGREFRSARESVALKDADLALAVLDPAGQVVHAQKLAFSGAKGADARFPLPDNAVAGGYELRLAMGGDTYTAAFRVADYQKPHFDIVLLPEKSDFKTGEAVGGKLQLNYPDGKPVARARVSLTARSQKLAMVNGELDYAGQFPVKLQQAELETDGDGVAKFSLPAATEPSRYLLTALATDGAAYRVRTSRELLVERGAVSFRLAAERQFSQPGQAVAFKLAASQRAGATVASVAPTDAAAATATPARPATWEWVRLEDRTKQSGPMPAGDTLSVNFPASGSYTLSLLDDKGRIVGAASHWVSGDGVKAPAGSVGMVLDRASYRAGDTAQVLVSFPEPVDNALLTLERDRVEATALMGRSADWIKSERVAPTQWKFTLPVRDAMSPNMTLSVAYVKNGDYVFQNQGIMVEQERIALAFTPDKAVYAPGDTVTIDVSATLAGKPVATDLAVGVVDEMIYVLQPEIAPAIGDFFYHPRRNNVRTSASLSFIGYDLATSKLGTLPGARQVNDRAVKVLERPRRDNIDTAAWEPRLATDASGHTRFSFTMPDSLTRWRITGRAMSAAGAVGQQVSWVRSDKAFYAKWTSPDWQRQGDKAQASLALFNQTGRDAKVEWTASGAGVERKDTVTVRPGVNFIALPLAAGDADRTGAVAVTLRQDDRVVDKLDVPVRRIPVAWRAPRDKALDMSSGNAPLALPPDASRVRVSLAQDAGAGAFSQQIDALIDTPRGGVEQTASRMLPLSLALQSLSAAQQPMAPALAQRLATARLALAQMAGPQAQFGWWGRGMPNDAFLTAYAYYADWRATQALRVTLPASNWQRLLDVYAKDGQKLPPLQRALALSWMQEMGLPVGSMAGGLADQLAAQSASDATQLAQRRGSLAMVDTAAPNPLDTRDMALVLAVQTAGPAVASAKARAAADEAAARLAAVDAPLVQALLMATQRAGADKAAAVLGQIRADTPSIDRAQTLLWLHRALGASRLAATDAPSLGAPWVRATDGTGTGWRLPPGTAAPATLELPAGQKAAWAFVSYESNEAQAPALDAKVERTLWRVVTQPRPAPEPPAAAAAPGQPAPAPAPSAPASTVNDGRITVKLEAVKPGTPLDTNALYLDQLTVTAPKAMRWSLVEAALPPGAAVEESTWGIDMADSAGKLQPMERAQSQATAQGYAVPVDTLAAGTPLTVRHLVRFAQRGTFKLPPARLFRVYEPEAKALEGNGHWASVEVR